MPLHRKVLLGLILGAITGVISNFSGLAQTQVWTGWVLPLLEFSGALFIRLITMIVIPLVAASLIIGVSSLGDLRKLGRIGARTLGYYLGTTAVAITIGLTLATLIRPGTFMSAGMRDTLATEFEQQASVRVAQASETPSVLDLLLNMVPSNPVAAAAQGQLLPLIIFLVVFAAALALVSDRQRNATIDVVSAVNDASLTVIGWVMKLAPVAVFALLTSVVSKFGIDILGSLAVYASVVACGLLLHVFLTYGGLVALLARMNPLDFFRRIREVPLIAFSTSSSSATLPVTMRAAEEKLGVSKPVSSFVLPLGATVNMDGTALYQGVATVFIAQVYGVDLTFAQLATVVLTATLASIGAAGVPSAGLITLILVLESVGLASHAATGIALILGVDRVLDMLRTATNVTGDLSCATYVSRAEERLAERETRGMLETAG